MHASSLRKIRNRIIERAESRCEDCFIPNYSYLLQNGSEILYKTEDLDFLLLAGAMTLGIKPFRIFLSLVHLDKDVTNNDDSNLKVVCQNCRLNYEKEDSK